MTDLRPADGGQRAERVFDHHDPAFVEERLERYGELRMACPVVHSPAHGGFWVLTRYAEVFEVARDEEHFSSAHGLLIPPGGSVGWLPPLQVDPPDLERFRRLLAPFLTPRALAPLEPDIRADIARCVDGFARTAEVVEELASPVPARATMRLIGLDPDDWRVFADPLHRAAFAEPESADFRTARDEIVRFSAIIEAEVDARRSRPREDLISRLLTSRYAGVRTSRDDVVGLVRMLIFGGMDTVSAATSNIIALLAVRSDLRAALASDRSLIPRAVEEFLRYEAPIQGFARYVRADVDVAGQRLRRDERLWLTWGSANHDPAVFESPEDLQLDRFPNRHLTFGVGAHRCLGSSMARMILKYILDALVARVPDFHLAENGVEQPATIGQILGKRAVRIQF